MEDRIITNVAEAFGLDPYGSMTIETLYERTKDMKQLVEANERIKALEAQNKRLARKLARLERDHALAVDREQTRSWNMGFDLE
jgi:hypothetical protein